MPAPDDVSTFGRYVVTATVAEGSLGVVYRARHTELQREAAVKVLRPGVRDNPAAVAGLVAEAQALARLDHPHVVALYDFVQEPGRTWLAEQWVDGATLDVLLDRHGRLAPEQALGAVAGALSGLAHAHEHGLAHRDVSAGNVLADMAGTSMLVDFGLAAPLEAAGAGTAGVVGTPAFMSPEAARGEPVGMPGDVYSAAALTYYLLTGAPVFPGTAWEMVAAHRDRPAPQLPGHGPLLADLLNRSLDKDPAVRPPDAGAFLAELEEAADQTYGAAWRSRASIAGLVATTAGAGAVATTVVAGGGATVVAPSLPAAVTGATSATVATGTKLGLRTLLGAGLGAAVLAAAAIVAVSAASGDDDEGPVSSPAVERTTEPEPSAEEVRAQQEEQAAADLEASAPEGRYFWTSPRNVNRTRGGAVTRDASASRGTWTFPAADCGSGTCSGVVVSSSGARWSFAWDGAALSISRPRVVNPKAACVDTATGVAEPIREAAAAVTWTYDVEPVEVTAGGDGTVPTAFRLSYDVKYAYRFFGTCEKADTDVVSSRSTIVVTKARPAKR